MSMRASVYIPSCQTWQVSLHVIPSAILLYISIIHYFSVHFLALFKSTTVCCVSREEGGVQT
jgi:hypothetical protein